MTDEQAGLLAVYNNERLEAFNESELRDVVPEITATLIGGPWDGLQTGFQLLPDFFEVSASGYYIPFKVKPWRYMWVAENKLEEKTD